MQTINTNLFPAQSGAEVVNLQDILLNFMGSGNVNFGDFNLVNRLAEERSNQIYGSATVEVLQAFQITHGLAISPVLNNQSQDKINEILTSQGGMPALPFVNLTGRILNTKGDPISAPCTVQLESAGVDGFFSIVHEPKLSSSNGSYQFSFDDHDVYFGTAKGFRVTVTEYEGLNTQIYSELKYLAGDNLQLNVTIPNSDPVIVSDFDSIRLSIAAITESDLNWAPTDTYYADNIALLSAQTAESAVNIQRIVDARHLADKLSLSTADEKIVYGLLSQNISAMPEVMISQPAELMQRALQIGVANNTIPAMTQLQIEDKVSSIRASLLQHLTLQPDANPEKSATARILQGVFNDPAKSSQFLDAYFSFNASANETFWNSDSVAGPFAPHIKDLKAAMQLAILTGNNPALTNRLLRILKGTQPQVGITLPPDPQRPQPGALTSLSVAHWQDLVYATRISDAPNFLYPSYVTGNNNTEKDLNYGKKLFDFTLQTFPTQKLASKVSAAGTTPFVQIKQNIGTFLQHNPGFDFRTTSSVALAADNSGFDFGGILVTDKDAFVSEIGTVQRLMQLTSDHDQIIALADNDFTSSLQIVKRSLADFATAMSGNMSQQVAERVYSTARSVAMYNTALLMELYNAVGGQLNPFVLDFATAEQQEAYAEWRSLFGSLDGCNCSQCQSVYSPSAYLTDLLRFMEVETGDSGVYAELDVRRPDIRHIELSCKNANTALPQIDIVNELLEDLVSTGEYKMYPRQSTASAESQRAVAEHINNNGVTLNTWNDSSKVYTQPVTIDSPYGKLRESVYPWSLPYNYYKRQIETHLDLAGVKSHELLQRFSAKDQLEAWQDSSFCNAYLGLSKEQADLITTSTSDNLELLSFYGFKPGSAPGSLEPISGISTAITTGNWITVLASQVDVFLQQTGLSYSELLEVLECYSVNPVSAGVRKINITGRDAGVPENSCALDLLRLDGIDVDTLKILYRFVRARRALGWSYYELDRALQNPHICTTPSSGQHILNSGTLHELAQLKAAADQLKISIEEACMLFGGINRIAYRNFRSDGPVSIPDFYQRIFRNPAVADISDPEYPFNEAAVFNTPVDRKTLQNHLSGALGINNASLSKILEAFVPTGTPDTITLSLSLLSDIYRDASIIKALKLDVSDWLALKRWLGDTDFFGVDGTTAYSKRIQFNSAFSPMESIRMMGFIRTIQFAGLSAKDLDYLLWDRIEDNRYESKLNDSLAKTLTGLRAALRKNWSVSYEATQDSDGSALMSLLLQAMTPERAGGLMPILQQPANEATGYDTTAATVLINETLSFLFPAGSHLKLIQYQPVDASFLVTATQKRQYVFDQLNIFMRNKTLKPLVSSFLAKEFKLAETVIVLLLDDLIAIPQSTIGSLLDPQFIEDDSPISRLLAENSSYEIPFQIMLRLNKAAMLIQRFGLKEEDMAFFWGTASSAETLRLADLPGRVTPLQELSATTFRKMDTFLRWMQVREFLGDKAPLLYKQIESIDDSSREDFLAGLTKTFATDISDIKSMLGNTSLPLGIFDVSWFTPAALPAVRNLCDFERPQLYLRIIDALEMQHLLPAPMATLASITDAVKNAETQQEANEIIQVVKAQYSETEWTGVIRPVNDLLRIERRDAMLAYLLANPPAGYENQWRTASDIFETLMIDVEMSPCMSTTRVLMAVNSIQLWVDRVLLGLEKSSSGDVLKMSKDATRQWATWRRRYRVWEANRKIFTYPENWIEPELRDGKTPLFVELEKFLKQNEVTAENVEAAYQTYLERLDEIAHLDIVGVYRETAQTDYTRFMYNPDLIAQDTIHVFGRTPAHPHSYYYRKRVAGEWTAWEKMDVQIDGDHFIPVIWRGRLRFYWLVFMKDQLADTGSKSRSDDPFVTPPSTRWKINLAWTELKNGRWTAKQVSKASLYSMAIEEEDPISFDHIRYFDQRGNEGREVRAWYPAGTLERQKAERISFYCSIDAAGDLKFEISEKVMRNSCPSLLTHLKSIEERKLVRTDGPLTDQDLPAAIALIDNNEMYNDVFPSKTGAFIVRFYDVLTMSNQSPQNHLYNPFKDLPEWKWEPNPTGLTKNGYAISEGIYRYSLPAIDGYSHYPNGGVKLLGLTPEKADSKQGGKYLVFPKQVPQNYVNGTAIRIPHFFYKDYDNCFFVEEIHEATKPTQVAVESFGQTGITLLADKGFGFGVEATVSNGVGNPTNMVRFDPVVAGGNDYRILYRFHNFHYDRVYDFRNVLYQQGLEGLLNRSFIESLNDSDNLDFIGKYWPSEHIDITSCTEGYRYPENIVDFRHEGAFAAYNWELFYHIPLLIANRLSQNQQFEEARRWYHFVFDPTASNPAGEDTTVADFWNFGPFHNTATKVPTLLEIMKDRNLQSAVSAWANNPFKPHLVARTRISAYMKTTVMKYLDNLIAWADALFRTDSREDIIEATLLYVLAAQILGRRPVTIPARKEPTVQTYTSMQVSGSMNAFGNALEKVESLMFDTGGLPVAGTTSPDSNMYYFCIPSNDKLTSYWDIIADRLFKIRHCRNIDGVERELALFDPPIDPALLVKAAAAGISLSEAMSALNAPMPHYRFQVMSQKATELAAEVKALGSQLMAALEKKDAEKLALLRSSQELRVLNALTELKEKGIEEAKLQLDGLSQQQKMIGQRRDHYKLLVDGGLNDEEVLQLDSMNLNIPLHITQGATMGFASIVSAFPQIHIGTTPKVETGGNQLAGISRATSEVTGALANINSTIGSMAATKGSFARRKQDWELQLKLADTELKQIDRQLVAAEIRKAMAEKELRNHQVQLENTVSMDEAMRSKYSNEELYDWMTGQIAFTYSAAYKLALDMAKRAERCYQNELNQPLASFIGYEYWDSLHKGLLAGESLAHDIKRMEASFLEKNKRTLELSKHISLATLAPDALLELKANKKCIVQVPEWAFDMDYPGQHMRRIKSVSISIPCIAGPYTTVSCKLSLLKSKYRKSGIASGDYEDDENYQHVYTPIQSIATSHAQNDSGMFEFSFRDERYLPFEGAGAIGEWRIELPAVYAQFSYESISDVILHINYTALDEGGLVDAATEVVKDIIEDQAESGFMRLFSVQQEFASDWHSYADGFSEPESNGLTVKLNPEQFPFYSEGKKITSNPTAIAVKLKPGVDADSNQVLDLSYRDGADIAATRYNYSEKSNNGLAIFEQDPLNPGPKLDIAGNNRILKLALRDNEDSPLNMATIADDVFFLTANWCEKDKMTDPADDDDENWIEDILPTPSLPELPDGVKGWWMAERGVSTESGKVTAWTDQSGSNNNFIADSLSLRPAYSPNGGANNTAFINFDGSNSLRVPAFQLNATQDVTVFTVFKTTSSGPYGYFCQLSEDLSGSQGGFCIVTNNPANTIEVAHIGDNGLGIMHDFIAGNSWMYLRSEHWKSKTSHEALPYVNGGVAGTYTPFGFWNPNNSNNFATSEQFYLGSRNAGLEPFQGLVSELIIFGRALNSSEISEVETYLQEKYSL